MYNRVSAKMVACDCNIFVLIMFYVASLSSSATVQVYVSTEHMNITYWNPEFFAFFNATSARPGRWEYKYYVNFYVRTITTFDNSIVMDIKFYEFLSNEYRRGFVEMHMGFCDLIFKDPSGIFGPAMRIAVPVCPAPPGEYSMVNMTVPDLPFLSTFPISKGRVFANASQRGKIVAAGYVDMEIKPKPRRKPKGTKPPLV